MAGRRDSWAGMWNLGFQMQVHRFGEQLDAGGEGEVVDGGRAQVWAVRHLGTLQLRWGRQEVAGRGVD